MKRKLVAALLSVAMVASITPVSALGPVATVEAAVSATSVGNAILGLGSTAKYTTEWKADYDDALADFNSLSDTDKASIADGQETLNKLGAAYAYYGEIIENAKTALSKITQVTADDFEDADGDVRKAIDAYNALNLSGSTVAGVDTSYNFQTAKNENGDTYIDAALLKKGKLISQTGPFGVYDKRGYRIANAYDYLEAIKDTTLNITTANYNSNNVEDAKLREIANDYKDLLANYSLIVAAENKIAEYTNAVEAVVKVANTADFTATIKDDEALAKVQAAYDEVKAAYNALEDQNLKNNAVLPSGNENKSGFDDGKSIGTALTEIAAAIKAYGVSGEERAAIEALTEQILALPTSQNVKITDEEAINAAYKAYIDYKTEFGHDNLPAAVKNYLDAALDSLNTVVATAASSTDIAVKQQRADLVQKYINKLPKNANNVTLEDEETVINAIKGYTDIYSSRTPWDGTSLPTLANPRASVAAGSWQALISDEDYMLLVACKEKIDNLHNENAQALANLKAAYNKLATDYTNTNGKSVLNKTIADAEVYSTAVKNAIALAESDIQAAKDAYNNANDYVKAEFDEADKEGVADPTKPQNLIYTGKLVALEKGIAKAKAYDETKDLLSKIQLAFANVETLKADKSNEAAIAQQVAAVDALLAQAKANEYIKADFKNWDAKTTLSIPYYSVTITTDNTANYLAGKALNTTPKQEAAPVVELINATTVLDNSDADKVYTESELDTAYAPIKAARDAYNALSDEAQAVVSNAGHLSNAEDAFDVALQKLLNEKAGKIGIITAGVQAEDRAIVEEIDALAEKYGTTYKNITANTNYQKYANTKAAIEAADKAAAQKSSQELLDLVNSIPETITKDDVASILLANDKYQTLSPAAKEIFDEALSKDNKTLAKDVLAEAYNAAKVLTFDLATIDAIADQTYTGSDIDVDITLKDASGAVISKDDYIVSYVNNVDAGEATVVVNPKASSKYTGTATATFTIKAADLSSATVTGATKTYTGKALETTVKAVLGDKTLTAGTDYDVAYTDNTNVGKATITITGKGNYTGTATGSFVVKPGRITLKSVTAGSKKLTAKYVGQTGASYKVAYKVYGKGGYKAVYATGLSKTVTGLKSGTTYKVKILGYVRVDGKTYYTGYGNILKVKVK